MLCLWGSYILQYPTEKTACVTAADPYLNMNMRHPLFWSTGVGPAHPTRGVAHPHVLAWSMDSNYNDSLNCRTVLEHTEKKKRRAA